MAAVGIVVAATSRGSESTGASRVERAMDLHWGSECDFDYCGIGVAQIPYPTPASVPSVDVTLTITFGYRTSRADDAIVGVSIDDGTPPYAPMRPSGFRIRSAPSGDTRTLTWIRRDLAAAGKSYTFNFAASPRDGDGDSKSRIVPRGRAAVVIESWTAGD